MKNLSLSLILVVITAVIGLGWLVTELNYWLDSDDFNISSEIIAYQKIGKGIAQALDIIPTRQVFIDNWQASNAALLSIQDLNNFPIPAELMASFELGEPLILESDGNVSLHFYMTNSNVVLSLILPDDTDLNGRSNVSLFLTLIFYGGVVAIILIWLYPLISRLMVLANVAKSFGEGDLSMRVNTSRISYIADIEAEFNHMADRIETLISDNKILSRAVSHNLKTPLARLRFGIDTWDETTDESQRKKYIQRINKDLVEMETLVETLLQYARLDEAGIQLQKQEINLKIFVSELFAEFEEIKIEYRYTESAAVIQADSKYLAMALNNLINNALNYAQSKILVSITRQDKSITVAVEDDGPGIPANEREEVIKPFLRGKYSQANKGHGMGLAIVTRIAEWHGGKLQLGESADLGGAKVSLHLALG